MKMNLATYVATAVFLGFLLLSHVFTRFLGNEIFRGYGYIFFSYTT